MEKKKKFNWQPVVGIGIYMLAGGICGAAMSGFIIGAGEMSLGLELLYLLGLFVGLCVLLFANIIIHELGHLIFGLLTGYRFSSFRIGNLMWMKSNGKLRFGFYSLAGTGGQCLMVPPEEKMPTFWYNMGGSILNLLVSGGFLAAYLLIDKAAPLSVLLLMGALIGLAFALTNGIPLNMGSMDNDGRNALSLRKNPATQEAFRLQLVVNHSQMQGTRLGEMPEEWFPQIPVEEMKNGQIAALGVHYCSRLMDLHRFEEARQHMEHLLIANIPLMGVHREILRCDLTFCELIGENRWSVIEGLRTKSQLSFLTAMKNNPSVLRTEYAYALLGEKDTATAQKKLAQFEKIAPRYPYPSEITVERELIEIAQTKNSGTPQ